MVLSLLIALQIAAVPAAASTHPRAGPEQLAGLQELIALGLPPRMEVPADQSSAIGEVMLAPLFHDVFMCSEHPQGQRDGLGDALGTDCMVVDGVQDVRRGYERSFRTSGKANADWYGWHAEIHALFDRMVKVVIINSVSNTTGKPPASGIVFELADGADVVFAHIADPRVKAGDRVTIGQVVAIGGNNGAARSRQIHIGAWKGK
jgi:hypothetical protein